MTSKFSEQLLEQRLSLSNVAQDLNADGHLTDQDLVRIGLAQSSPRLVPADSFVVPDGMEVSVWATSPMLLNPTNMDTDAAGAQSLRGGE